jgi:hypothetical protein
MIRRRSGLCEVLLIRAEMPQGSASSARSWQ